MYIKLTIFFIMLMMNLIYMLLFTNLLIEWEIYMNESLDLNLMMIFDNLSFTFLLILLIISLSVMIYSKNYMIFDKFKFRFIIMLILFIMSMILLIISPSIIMILVSWDMLGIVSFCLISYYQNLKSLNASLVTFLFNRLGDSFIYMMLYFILISNSLNFYFYEFISMNKLALILLFMASMTKSAQMPFSIWLPMAMAAPTPVSSLVHSSTLVTSGIFLLIRFNYFFSNYFIEILFIITLLLSNLSACLENDLKKIIALSTLSQLSLMIIMLMEGFLMICFLHLLIHAAFKCMLFLCLGFIIHSFNNNQDIRFLSNFVSQYPLMMSYLNISFFSLMGLPFLSAFYSKDYFLEIILFNSYVNLFMLMMIYLSVLLTIIYSFRLIFMLNFSYYKYNVWGIYFKEYKFISSLFILMFFSMMSGSMFMWLFSLSLDILLMNLWMKLSSLILFIGSILFNVKYNNFLLNMFLSDYFNLYSLFNLMFYCYNIIEKGWMEKFSGKGIYNNYKMLIINYSYYQFNKLYYYLIIFIIFMFMMI